MHPIFQFIKSDSSFSASVQLRDLIYEFELQDPTDLSNFLIFHSFCKRRTPNLILIQIAHIACKTLKEKSQIIREVF